jgi:hypothetical protein
MELFATDDSALLIKEAFAVLDADALWVSSAAAFIVDVAAGFAAEFAAEFIAASVPAAVDALADAPEEARLLCWPLTSAF